MNIDSFRLDPRSPRLGQSGASSARRHGQLIFHGLAKLQTWVSLEGAERLGGTSW